MHRFLVIEARRLLPLLFLLVLLVSLSIYDNFFRQVEQVVGPEEDTRNVLTFITADRGELEAEASFSVIGTLEEWARLQQEYPALPDYPFNDRYELAVSAINAAVKQIRLFPQEDGFIQVQVRVQPEPRAYHVVTVERERVGEQTRWLFLDEEDRLLHELTVAPAEEDATEVTEEGEGAVGG